MNCLFCKKLCEESIPLKEFRCYQMDHNFYYYKVKPHAVWFVLHHSTNLFLNAEGVGDNDDPSDVYLIKFEKRLKPPVAIKYLRKTLKLKAFL